MDAVAIFGERTLTLACQLGFACSVCGGPDGSLRFYAGLIQVLGLGMMFMFIGVQCTIALLAYDAMKRAHPLPVTIFVSIAVGALYFSVRRWPTKYSQTGH